jgi:hypothetical protein
MRQPSDNESAAGAGDTIVCAEAIRALADGDLGRWQGLPNGCSRNDVEGVLTLVTTVVNESNHHSGLLGYAPTPGAPNGLSVSYERGAVDVITVAGPALKQNPKDVLGPPEEILPSFLEGSRSQCVYPGLGLAFHMDVDERNVNWLYAFGPTTGEVYRTSPLSQVRTLRHQRR